jgi:two-component system nitrate/nitrite response regulator NarL
VATILISTVDRQTANQWTALLSAEHSILIPPDPLPSVGFVREKQAEMAIVDGELLADKLTLLTPFINIGLKSLIIGKNWPAEKQIDALIAGCHGYCEFDAASEVLPKAVASVLKGDVWVPRQLIPKVIGMLAKLSSRGNPTDNPHQNKKKNLDLLTHREIDVVKMLGEGLSNKSIASMLNISERTVKAHLTSIFQKLEVQDRLQLALFLKDIH